MELILWKVNGEVARKVNNRWKVPRCKWTCLAAEWHEVEKVSIHPVLQGLLVHVREFVFFFRVTWRPLPIKVVVRWDLYFRFWKKIRCDWSVKSKEKCEARWGQRWRWGKTVQGALNCWTFILRAAGSHKSILNRRWLEKICYDREKG